MKRASTLGDAVVVGNGGQWLSLRSKRAGVVFAEIRAHLKSVEIFLLPSPRNLRDFSGLARAAPPTQGWGWFRSKIVLRDMNHSKIALGLLTQSYLFCRRRMSLRGRR